MFRKLLVKNGGVLLLCFVWEEDCFCLWFVIFVAVIMCLCETGSYSATVCARKGYIFQDGLEL